MTDTVCTPIISLDLETTGLDPARHAPWEIAWKTAIHYEDGDDRRLILQRRGRFLLDVANAPADPRGLEVGGFWQRYSQKKVEPWPAVQASLIADIEGLKDATMRLWRSVNARAFPVPQQCFTVHLVGAVPQFDHRMLERWVGWLNGLWHYHLIDVETLVAGKLGIRPPYDTDELTRRALGDDWDDSHKHEAMADVDWNLALYASAYDLTIDTADVTTD